MAVAEIYVDLDFNGGEVDSHEELREFLEGWGPEILEYEERPNRRARVKLSGEEADIAYICGKLDVGFPEFT